MRNTLGGIAQLVERLHGMQEVSGSNPLISIVVVERRNKCPWRRIKCQNEGLPVKSEELGVNFAKNYMSSFGNSEELGINL